MPGGTEKGMDNFKVLTGLPIFDKHTGGLHSRNSYMIAGLEKSGKSALLLTMVNYMLCDNKVIAYIDTELGISEVSQRLAAILNEKPISEVSPEHQKEWISALKNNFFYAGIDSEDDIKTEGVISFEKIKSKVQEYAKAGAQVVIIDNLTILSTINEGYKKGWEILGRSITQLISEAKTLNIVLIFVVHTNESVVFTETPTGISSILKANRPRDIFKSSLTVTKRPRLGDVFGGGTAHSQISGSLLLWRPYQKFSDDINKLSCLILDSFRHCAPKDIMMTFHGEYGTFTEDLEGMDYLKQ